MCGARSYLQKPVANVLEEKPGLLQFQTGDELGIEEQGRVCVLVLVLLNHGVLDDLYEQADESLVIHLNATQINEIRMAT